VEAGRNRAAEALFLGMTKILEIHRATPAMPVSHDVSPRVKIPSQVCSLDRPILYLHGKNGAADTAVVELSSDIVAEIEQVRGDTDLEGFVYQVVHAYVTTLHNQKAQEQLARDYDELAAIYPEIAAELADDVWAPLENEALAILGLTQSQSEKENDHKLCSPS
jgi:hypothetical protein